MSNATVQNLFRRLEREWRIVDPVIETVDVGRSSSATEQTQIEVRRVRVGRVD